MSDYMNQTEPYLVTIARLTAERDAALAESGRFAKIAGDANSARYKAERERDENNMQRVKALHERDEANAEFDKAVCDLVDQNNELLAARAELAKLQDRKPVRLPYHNADGTPCTLKRPTGRLWIQALEARITALEGVVNAR